MNLYLWIELAAYAVVGLIIAGLIACYIYQDRIAAWARPWTEWWEWLWAEARYLAVLSIIWLVLVVPFAYTGFFGLYILLLLALA